MMTRLLLSAWIIWQAAAFAVVLPVIWTLASRDWLTGVCVMGTLVVGFSLPFVLGKVAWNVWRMR